MDNLQLCNAVEEWVNDYSSSYLSEVKDSLSKEIDCEIYRGDFIHKDEVSIGGRLYISKGLTSWTTSTEVAYAFSNRHAENFEEEVEEDEYNELENYRQVIYVLQGKKKVIDLIEIARGLPLDKHTIGLIADEEEVILDLKNDTTYIVEEVRNIKGISYLYIQNN